MRRVRHTCSTVALHFSKMVTAVCKQITAQADAVNSGRGGSTAAAERLVVADVVGADVFEAQGVDDQLLNFQVQIAHLRRVP